MDARRAAVGVHMPEADKVEISLKPAAERLRQDDQPLDRKALGKTDAAEPTVWIGCTNKYFGAMMYVVPLAEDALAARDAAAEFYVERTKATDSRGLYLTGVTLPERPVRTDEPLAVKLDVYVGPKKRSVFAGEGPLPYKPIYERLNYLSTIELSGCFCARDSLSWAMMWLLEKLSVVAFGNYGVAIIFLVILVQIVLFPLTLRGQVSMMKMQKLTPQMKKLKEKYKDDKDALNREMMALYKQQGFTPVLGCLPMFMNMPVWISLWGALQASAELRHASFLPVWITDLAAPDGLITFDSPLTVPLVGWMIYGFNLLPILAAAGMFLQMKLSPQTPTADPDSDQAKQQKMMLRIMPVMMLFIFYQMPSGLNLYIMTSGFMRVLEQRLIRRHMAAKEEQAAARETTIEAPGKPSRGSRPKKPKGPFWIKKG